MILACDVTHGYGDPLAIRAMIGKADPAAGRELAKILARKRSGEK